MRTVLHRVGAAGALLLMAAYAAQAQEYVIPGKQTATTNWQQYDTGVGAAGGTTPRVVVGQDSTTIAGSATLPAGTAVIGKVGIDQTTPGTTNAVSATNLPATVSVGTGAQGASSPRVTVATDTATIAGTAPQTGAGTAAGSLRVELPTDGTGKVGLNAGTNNVGNTGAIEIDVADTPTIQNASYVSGNCMGGFRGVTVATATGKSGVLTHVMISSKGGGVTALTMYVFDTNPSGSTCTDKSTFTLAAADISKEICKPLVLTPSADVGTTVTSAEATNLVCHFTTAGDAKVYIGIVSGGTWTPASTTDLVAKLEGQADQ